MGGRGKTPVTALVARILLDAGERPAILSRGYGRRQRTEHVVVVSDGAHVLADLDRSGDEPLMLARNLPGVAVLVHEIRAMAAAVAERVVGATVHVLDDGFQHASIQRDVDIVIVTADDLSGRRLPFGKLRSPVSALSDVDAVLIDGDGDDARRRVAGVVARPADVFAVRRSLGVPVALEPDRMPAHDGRRVVAVAGIARPARFFDALRLAGWDIAQVLPFPDHHRYAVADVERIARAARQSAALAVVTTEKDAVRLLPFRPLPIPFLAVPLHVAIEPRDRFRQWLLTRLTEVRA